MSFSHSLTSSSLFASALLITACSGLIGCGDGGGSENENEVITSIVLTFTPGGGGAAITATFNDADGDGGAAPTVDPINLTAGTTYATTVKFENRLETPAEDITTEVKDESDEHQIFFTGTGVSGPASNQPTAPLAHTYADTDANGLPIGLASSFAARTGTGQLIVTLRHLPPVNNTPAKTAAAATTVRDSGFATLGGSTDAQVTFAVTVP
jgi:hypothetical protein